MKISLAFVLLLSFKPLIAEELITFPIAFFAVKCSEIWEAKPLNVNTIVADITVSGERNIRWISVQVTKVYRSAYYKAGDTVWVTCGSAYFWPQKSEFAESESCLQANDTIDRFWFFGAVNKQMKRPIMANYLLKPPYTYDYLSIESSGIWLENQDGNVFAPFQLHDTFSPYRFTTDFGGEKWNRKRVALSIEKNVQLADELFAFRQIKNSRAQNDSLFAWINRNEGVLTKQNYRDQESWRFQYRLPFSWILGNGEDDQSWQAILLFNKLFPEEWMIQTSALTYLLNEEMLQFERSQKPIAPFHSVDGIMFLTERLRKDSLSEELREKAQELIEFAYRGNLSLEDRKILVADIISSLKKVSLSEQEKSVQYVQDLGFWMENDLRKSMLVAYDFLIARYKKAPYGYSKSSLAAFLVKECSEKEWKKLTGNDAKILVRIQRFCLDTVNNVFRFECNQEAGYEQIFACPTFEMFQLSARGKHINKRIIPPADYCADVNWTRRPLYGLFRVQVPMARNELQGTWYLRASGTAGHKQELQWATEVLIGDF